jgi:hypothetical protein
VAQNNQGNQGFVIPPATPASPSGPATPTPASTGVKLEIPGVGGGTAPPPDTSTQALAIAGVILLIWIAAAFFFRRKWAVSFKEKRVSESNAEASGWAFFGALIALGVGAAAAFFDKFATIVYLGPLVGASVILLALALFMARK